MLMIVGTTSIIDVDGDGSMTDDDDGEYNTQPIPSTDGMDNSIDGMMIVGTTPSMDGFVASAGFAAYEKQLLQERRDELEQEQREFNRAKASLLARGHAVGRTAPQKVHAHPGHAGAAGHGPSNVRSQYTLAAADHGKRVREATAVVPSPHDDGTVADLALADFDVEDNHVGVLNRTSASMPLANYALQFRDCGACYEFPRVAVVPPNASLSVWYGQGHGTVRDAPSAASLRWVPRSNNDAVAADAFDEVVDLVNARGDVVSSARANCPRHVSAKPTSNNIGTKRGTTDDAYDDGDDDVNDSDDDGQQHSRGQRERSTFKSKRVRFDKGPSAASRTSPGALVHRNEENECSNRSWSSPSSSSSSSSPTLRTDPRASRVATVGSTLPPDVAALRPTLFGHRQAGALSLPHAHRSAFEGHVAVRVCNSGPRDVDMVGWRLLVLGHPTLELDLGPQAVVPAGGTVTLVSGVDAGATGFVDAVCAHWRCLDGGGAAGLIDEEAEDGDDVDLVVPDTFCGSSSSSSGSSSDSSTRSSSRGGGAFSPAQPSPPPPPPPRDVRVLVAGLGAAARGDAVALYLVDADGRCVCMASSVVPNGPRRTVFGDVYPEAQAGGATATSQTKRMWHRKGNSSMSCTIQ